MNALSLILLLFSFSVYSQDPTAYLNAFDAKVYSLKTKGVKDFVVDIESSKLSKQMNDQMIFGKVDEVIFRTYWTANPERLAIEVLGLPDGFKEIKEELKVSMLALMDGLLPMTTVQRFAGYKISQTGTSKEFIAKDTTGIAAVPAFVLKFDKQDRLVEVEGKKNVGSMVSVPNYEKATFADGKWVLKTLVTTTSENGQTLTNRKEYVYGKSQGVPVLTAINVTTEQKRNIPNSKPLILEEQITFKNYKINAGEALKHFLGESQKVSP